MNIRSSCSSPALGQRITILSCHWASDDLLFCLLSLPTPTPSGPITGTLVYISHLASSLNEVHTVMFIKECVCKSHLFSNVKHVLNIGPVDQEAHRLVSSHTNGLPGAKAARERNAQTKRERERESEGDGEKKACWTVNTDYLLSKYRGEREAWRRSAGKVSATAGEEYRMSSRGRRRRQGPRGDAAAQLLFSLIPMKTSQTHQHSRF